MKAISKEMRKRQKHFPWLDSFIKESFKTYPNCKKTLHGLVENIEKEVNELKKGQKRKTKALFETVNDLYLHFWWKMHWKKNSQWKIYWNMNTSHPYHSSENIQYFGKLLNFLIYLGIILSQGASDSLWINRVLQAINILPAADEIVYDALLQLQCLKKKYQSSYLEILRHILCSEIILEISDPTVYIKSLMLFRRLKIFIKDEVARASLISTASKIKPPSNLRSWLSSLKISIDDDKSIVDQLLKKNSKQIFKKLHHVLFESENGGHSETKDKERNSKLREKSENGKVNLPLMSVGPMSTPVKNSNAQLFNDTENNSERNNQLKKVLDCPKVCSKIKKSKKKKKPATTDVNGNINKLATESCTKPKKQSKNTKTGKIIERTADSQNISRKHKKSKKKKKSKAKKDGESKNVKNKKDNTKPNKATKSTKSEGKKKKLRKKKKSEEISDIVNVIPDNKKSDLCNLKTCLDEANSAINDDSVLVNNGLHTQKSNKTSEYTNKSALSKKKLMLNAENESEGDENGAIKKLKLSHSENDKLIPRPVKESHITGIKYSDDKKSNENYLKSKLPNLLANYEKYSSSEENELAKKDISSCPLVESADNVLVPDTCQNDFDSIVPFNLDSWIPSNDTSISNDGSQISDKHLSVSLNDATKNDIYKNNESDYSNSGFNDSAAENTIDSEVSRDTLFSDHGSIISNKYPYVSVIDIKKNKKLKLKQNSDKSYSSLDDDSIMGFMNDSEMSRDAYISKDGSEISGKNPHVFLIDVKKVKSPCLIQKSDNSSVDSCYIIGNIDRSEMSTTNFISSEESQLSDKVPIDIQKSDKITNHHSDSNYDPILGNVNSNELPTPNQNNYLCHDLHSNKNMNNEPQNTQGGNHDEENEIKDFLSPCVKPNVQDKKFPENHSPCNKHSKTKTTLSTKRKRKQTSNNVKQRQKRRLSSDNNKDCVRTREEECLFQDLKASAKDVNSKACLNDLSMLLGNHGDIDTQEKETITTSTAIALNHSDVPQYQELNTLLANHGDIETQEKETITNSIDIALNHSDVPQFQELNTLLANHGDIETQEKETKSHSTNISLNHSDIQEQEYQNHTDIQEISQIQEHNTLCERPINIPHELNEEQSMPHALFAVTEKQPCLALQNKNHQNNSTCSIETVIDEYIESELSKSHSDRLSGNVNENVHSIDKNGFNPFQAGSSLEPSNCFGYQNSVNTPCQNNNQSNRLSISTSTGNRSIENEDAQFMLNRSVNENSNRVVLTANPNHRRENVNLLNTNLNSGNTSFVVDCNIVNDFDSRNSSRAGSLGSGETHTIKFVVNLINAHPENSSNFNSQTPYCSGNGFLAASNSSGCQHSSVAPGQVLNNSNCSLPVHRDNCYFSQPPFFTKRTVNELVTPPDSESHLRIPRLSRAPSFSKDETNCIPSQSKDRCSTPTNLSRKKHRSGFSHSSEATNEWGVSHLDLNTSFSNIPYQQSEHCEDIVNDFNVQQKGKNHCEKRKLISKTDKGSACKGGKTAFQDSEQLVTYRNSRPSIYSDESEDALSVISTMSQLSGEETDHSLFKITEEAISPKSPPHVRNNIAPKIKTKKLFREAKSALDSLSDSSVERKSTTVKKTISQKKRMGKGIGKNTKKLKSTMDHKYNLRSRKILTPPSKLQSDVT